ncbi:MAG: hypothetical protein ABJB66_02120 [Gemmatimonadaceae bacterium]
MPIQPFPIPQSQRWPQTKALLFIHGVGNVAAGSYAEVAEQIQNALGEHTNDFALYFLYYDQIADWGAARTATALNHARVVNGISSKLPHSKLGNVVADFVGDVLRPTLSADARLNARTAVLHQLRQIRDDGVASGVPVTQQRISVIAHSVGCFHLYEALSHASLDPREKLGPSSAQFVLEQLIMMASPVQLVRTIGKALGPSLANSSSIYAVSQPTLRIPAELGANNALVNCAKHVVSITGELDPIGGYFFRDTMTDAYMNLPDQSWFVDEQRVAGIRASEDLSLADIFQNALRDGGFPHISAENPHNWATYLQRHSADIRSWLL